MEKLVLALPASVHLPDSLALLINSSSIALFFLSFDAFETFETEL